MKASVIILSFLFSVHVHGQTALGDLFLNSAQKKWAHAREYILACAKDMPADSYDFQPTPEVLSFKKQLIHTMQNMNWISNDYLGGQGITSDVKDADPTKEELIMLLEKSFDNAALALSQVKEVDLGRKVEFFAGEMSILQMIELLDDHMTHHKGQLVVYLRLQGIKPPRFVGW